MLKLDQLELSGFKSFVDTTRVSFAGGMTAIVGPNGCGKSNLADAVVWVLGERSAKSLRGAKMEDVIFNGSAKRRPLGMAEAHLTFHADASLEAADDGRLVIGRRLFRSGESHYFLNGKRVRLKEIRDLLMDTGLGIRAYSVIEQGKIGTILSGKPIERRRLLEEAAGITRYRERRRLAELKLESATANLNRLDDVVSEVERTRRSLKRQAGAARRYKKRRERYKELLRRSLAARSATIAGALAALGGRIGGATERDAELSAELHRNEAELAQARETLDREAEALAERHRLDSELAATIEGKQEFLKGSSVRLTEIDERVEAGREEARGRAARLEELDAERKRLEARVEELDAERQRAASELGEEERRIVDVERLVGEAEEGLEALRGRLLASLADVNGLRQRLHREQLDREKGEFRLRHLTEELARQRAAVGTTREEHSEALRRAEDLERQRAEAETERDERRSAVEAAEAHLTELAAKRDRAEDHLSVLVGRRDLLAELAQTYRDRRDRVREAATGAGLGEPDFLGDRLRVPAGWERTVDLYLGELADAVVLAPGADADRLAAHLAGGRGTVRLLDPGAGAAATVPDDRAIQGSLAAALGLPETVAAALPPAWLVDSPADAVRLARRHPGAAFLSRDRTWAAGGLVTVQGREARPGVLARDQEAAKLEAEIPSARAEVEALGVQIEEATGKLAERRHELAATEERLEELRRELAVAEARRDDLSARLRRLEVQTETVDTERGEVERELGSLAAGAERYAGEMGRAESLHADLENAFDSAQKRVEEARGERETARTTGASRRGRLELTDERLDSHRQEGQRLARERAETERRIATWDAEAERLAERRRELEAARRRAEEELQQALEEREASRETIVAEREKLDERRAALRQLEATIETLRTERDEVRQSLSELKVERAEGERDLEHLAASYREEFDEAPPEALETDDDPQALDEELERLKEQLERIGPVNLLAAEEFEEHDERHRFLTEQREDVASSVVSLKKTIREINRTSSERFQVAFEEVNESFQKTFTELFRGGHAEMRIQDEDDLLESGIEILARPPGKRLQNILLLSGGEKALTAIALLFALFRTKPSPFCILDEVDAPLDDINTLRFVELLKQMAGETQFVLITHNKLTMEAASTLYGVTMQEKGCSALVSVELDEVQAESPPPGEPAGEAVAVPA